MKKRHLFKYFLVCFIGIISIALGYFTGNLLTGKFFAIDKYAGISKSDLIEDVSTISYEGKTPDQLSATDAFIVALHILHNQHTYIRNSNGELETSLGVKQYIHNRSGKSGDMHFMEVSTFSSIIKKAGRFNYKIGDTIRYQNGTPSNTSLDSVQWTDDYGDYTYDEYSELLGRRPEYESTYVVSSKTQDSASSCSINNGLYTYTIELNPTLATISYLNEISFVSDIDKSSINFSKVTLEFTVDKNFVLISQKNQEVYSVKYSGIPVTISSVYNITFTY